MQTIEMQTIEMQIVERKEEDIHSLGINVDYVKKGKSTLYNGEWVHERWEVGYVDYSSCPKKCTFENVLIKSEKGRYNLENCSFSDCTFKNVQFKNYLKGCIFADCSFVNCSFADCNLQNVRFTNCTFSKETDMDRSDLSGCIITNCKGMDISLQFVTFSKETSIPLNFLKKAPERLQNQEIQHRLESMAQAYQKEQTQLYDQIIYLKDKYDDQDFLASKFTPKELRLYRWGEYIPR